MSNKYKYNYKLLENYELSEQLKNELVDVLPKKSTDIQIIQIQRGLEQAARCQYMVGRSMSTSSAGIQTGKLLNELRDNLESSLELLKQLDTAEEKALDQHYNLVNREWLIPLCTRSGKQTLYDNFPHIESILINNKDSRTYEILARIKASIESRYYEYKKYYTTKNYTFTLSLSQLLKHFSIVYPKHKIDKSYNSLFNKLVRFLFTNVFGCSIKDPSNQTVLLIESQERDLVEEGDRLLPKLD